MEESIFVDVAVFVKEKTLRALVEDEEEDPLAAVEEGERMEESIVEKEASGEDEAVFFKEEMLAASVEDEEVMN